MANTCLEIVWLRYLLQDLKVSQLYFSVTIQRHYIQQQTQYFMNAQNTLRWTATLCEKNYKLDNQFFICTDTVSPRRYFYEGTRQETFLTPRHKWVHDLQLPTQIICNYCTQLYAINLIMIESNDQYPTQLDCNLERSLYISCSPGVTVHIRIINISFFYHFLSFSYRNRSEKKQRNVNFIM